MQVVNLTFPLDFSNASVQVGDIAYYANPSVSGNSGFSTSNNNPIIKLGTIIDIVETPVSGIYSIQVLKPNNVTTPTIGSYIMFEKNKKVNSSNLTGYYAEVQFKNYSSDRVQLFSVASEFSESSK